MTYSVLWKGGVVKPKNVPHFRKGCGSGLNIDPKYPVKGNFASERGAGPIP